MNEETLTIEELIILLKHLAGKHGGHVRTNIVTVNPPQQLGGDLSPFMVQLEQF
jgi:hypothetical protein